MRLSVFDGIIIMILVITASPVHRSWREFLLHQLIVWFLQKRKIEEKEKKKREKKERRSLKQDFHFIVFFKKKFFKVFSDYYYSQLLYSSVLCSRADSPRTLACNSEGVTVSFYTRVLLISTEVVYWQRSVVVAWLVPREMLPFRRRFCVHHSTMHQFTVSLHSTPHRQGVCVFSCNLPPALLAQ